MAEMLTTDLRTRAKAIAVPVLLIGAVGAIQEGMRPALRAAYEAQVAALPHARVVFAERARHFVMLDDPSFLSPSPGNATPRPIVFQDAAERYGPPCRGMR